MNKPKTLYRFHGYFFETEEELMIARMLWEMDIPFLHHVQFVFPFSPAKSRETIWCPDFLLGYPFRWIGKEPCNGSVIVGIEIKKQYIDTVQMDKSIALCQSLGIPIVIVTRAQIAPYVEQGELPLLRIAS
jgi:hypothetical protein